MFFNKLLKPAVLTIACAAALTPKSRLKVTSEFYGLTFS